MPARKSNKSKKKGSGKASQTKLSFEQLCEQAEQCLVMVEPQQAITLLQQALSMSPEGTPAMDLLAQAYLELGQPDDALVWLEKSTKLAPEDNFHKWMSSGAIMSGFSALECFQKGVVLMQRDLQQCEEKDEQSELALEISSAYCAMSELYVTDLCDEACAEAECEKMLQAAVEACPANANAHYQVANLRMIQKKPEEAAASVQRSVDILLSEDIDGFVNHFGYETTHNVAKAALELKLYEPAVQLFEKVLAEDDRFVEVWYYTGHCYSNIENGHNLARQYFERAKLMMEMSTDSESSSENPDQTSMDAASAELMQKIVAELAALPPATEDAAEDFEGDDDDDDDMPTL